MKDLYEKEGIDKNSKNSLTASSPFFSEIIDIHFNVYKALYAHSFESGDRQMIYILIISLLTENPFYLLRQHSF